MKIGLFRHFKTSHRYRKGYTSAEYDQEYHRYEDSHILPPGDIPPLTDYHLCYCSPAHRALETAGIVFTRPEDIIITKELMEIPLKSWFKSERSLPIQLWHFLCRTAWFFNSRRMPENRKQSHQRAQQFLSTLPQNSSSSKEGNNNILVVSHGFFMILLQDELLKMGYKGKKFMHPNHGGLYEFSSP